MAIISKKIRYAIGMILSFIYLCQKLYGMSMKKLKYKILTVLLVALAVSPNSLEACPVFRTDRSAEFPATEPDKSTSPKTPGIEETAFRFLDVPVSGTKEDMILALKKKNFDQPYLEDYLTGIFNGEDVRIYIGTNHGIVDQITVEYPYCSEDNDTRVKYNILLSRFNRNEKYVSINPRTEIPIDEEIYRELYKNSKYYDAVYFFLHPTIDPDKWVQAFKQAYQKHYMKTLEGLSYDEMEEALFCLPENVSDAVCGIVWFTLSDSHRIKINYVNLRNRPRGEDL